MARLDKLIEELCPIDMEYLKIEEIADKIFAGGTPRTSIRSYYDGKIPWLRSGEINFNEITTTERTITEQGYDKSSAKWIKKNSVLIALTGATVARTGVNKIPLTANQSVCAIEVSDKINYKFLYYFLANNYEYLRNRGQGALTSLTVSYVKNILIPVPPLPVQEEIVRILDNFTELTAELTARKQQYEYYRDELLTFGDEVEWKTLGEVSNKTYSGGTPRANTPEFYNNGNIPWLRTQEVVFNDIYDTEIKITKKAIENSSAKWIPENCVIVAISGATAGRSAINKIPLTTNQHCFCIEVNPTKALYRYVFHWVSSNYENLKSLGQGARGDLNGRIISNFKIPIPPLAEQERIVSILDKFDALVNDISIGLPAEIGARQKQYEYYREKLLTFKELKAKEA